MGTEAPPVPDVDPASLVRFSNSVPTKLSVAERESLAERARQLDPWLQGPFLLGGDLVVGGAWRVDQRWVDLGREVPEDLSGKRILDTGSNAGCALLPSTNDQRGANFPRVVDGNNDGVATCDKGAYEAPRAPTIAKSFAPATVRIRKMLSGGAASMTSRTRPSASSGPR